VDWGWYLNRRVITLRGNMTIMFIVIKIVIKIAIIIIIIVNRGKDIVVGILVISYDGVVMSC